MDKLESFSDAVHVRLADSGYAAVPWEAVIDLVFELIERCSDRRRFADIAGAGTITRVERRALQRYARRTLRQNGVRPRREVVECLCESLVEQSKDAGGSAVTACCGEACELLGCE